VVECSNCGFIARDCGCYEASQDAAWAQVRRNRKAQELSREEKRKAVLEQEWKEQLEFIKEYEANR
jgi:hypothetical protein